jgi:hypothetical protein
VDHQQELEVRLKQLRNSECGIVLLEWLEIEFDKKKNKLVDDNSELTRGMAMEVRNMIKIFK